jgi:hypothetical protein
MSAVSLRTVSDYKPVPDTTTNQKHTRLDLATTEDNSNTIQDAPRRGCLNRVARNINKVALPLAVVAMTAAIPTADAGPLAYAACVTICCGTFPPLIPVLLPSCAVGCAPALALPTP